MALRVLLRSSCVHQHLILMIFFCKMLSISEYYIEKLGIRKKSQPLRWLYKLYECPSKVLDCWPSGDLDSFLTIKIQFRTEWVLDLFLWKTRGQAATDQMSKSSFVIILKSSNCMVSQINFLTWKKTKQTKNSKQPPGLTIFPVFGFFFLTEENTGEGQCRSSSLSVIVSSWMHLV